jgi:primosomal protein N' (replication factor Y) (superfamily II helicase)
VILYNEEAALALLGRSCLSALMTLAPRLRILLAHPLLGPFDYAPHLSEPLQPGDVVQVPLGRQSCTGVVWEAESHKVGAVADAKLRPVTARLPVPALAASLRRFIDWVARYYVQPPGAVLRMALSAPQALEEAKTQLVYRASGKAPDTLTPKRLAALQALGTKQGTLAELARMSGVTAALLKGLAACGALQAAQDARDAPIPQPDADAMQVALSDAQRASADQLVAAVQSRSFKPVLLDGITGSGKTEVYFEAMAQVIREGGQALVLLPEIAMTRQWFDRFKARFGCAPVEWHSDLTATARRRGWRAIAEGRAPVVVGARSALFLPFADLRLIIVDEEHEQSYKQEDGVPYQARDCAVVRARFEQCSVVLASATPALETRVNAEKGKYGWLKISARFGAAILPSVQIIDLRSCPPPSQHWLSTKLVAALRETLARGEQGLLFLNRRGYAPLTLCRTCGTRVNCPQCASWLVEHRLTARLHCHHCGFATPIPKKCVSCNDEDSLVACGPGVERIAEEVMQVLPEARTMLVTSDTITSPAKAAALMRAVESHEINLLIGTQLATKGHHFPNLTCVGVVDADLGLGGGDLRGAERSFQQITQAAGRAGRADKPGEVYLQSYNPDHPLFAALLAHDRDGFYEQESANRQRFRAPPFVRYAAIIVSGKDKAAVENHARLIARASPRGQGIDVFGPAPAPLSLLRGNHRVRLLLHVDGAPSVSALVSDWMTRIPRDKHVRVQVDVDPYSFL